MSNFLGFESPLVPLGASIVETHNTIKAAFTSRGWQVLGEDTSTNPTRLDIIPPVSEVIGNERTFEFLRLRFTDNSISFVGLKQYKVDQPQHVHLYPKTPGAVLLSCTLNGVTISYNGSASNTATDNLLGLYSAIRDSASPVFQGWEWDLSYPAPQNGNDSKVYIYGKNKTAEANKTFTVNENVNGGPHTDFVPANRVQPETMTAPPAKLTIDLVNGFIYYLQVSSRGCALATRTNAGFFGPVHACWGRSEAANAYLPSDSEYVTPLELLVGWDDDANNTDSWGYATGMWMLPHSNSDLPDPMVGYQYNFASPGKGIRRHRFTDVGVKTASRESVSITGGPLQLLGSGIFWDNSDTGNDFQIHRVKTSSHKLSNSTSGGNEESSLVVLPGFEIEDWYKFRGSATNEALILVADTVGLTKLAANYIPGDTSISLASTAMLQPAGFIILGTEAIQYTGITGNTLTGVTGGRYATKAARHFTGDSVAQGLWFVILNGGALLAGYNKPV